MSQEVFLMIGGPYHGKTRAELLPPPETIEVFSMPPITDAKASVAVPPPPVVDYYQFRTLEVEQRGASMTVRAYVIHSMSDAMAANFYALHTER
jgi:hypothetical protein